MITAIITSLWLGVMTSISPCPLATNIAAVSYLSKDLSNKRTVLISSAFYTLGRVIAYTFVSAVIVVSIISTPRLSHFLQVWGIKIIGPVLVVTGAFLLEIFTIPMPSFGGSSIKPERFGLIGAFILGFIFAMSFCPVSAALFFGSLIPLAVSAESKFALPLIYGVGTALPVIIFAILLSISAEKVSIWFKRITVAEIWIRRVFGLVLIFIGIYYTIRYVFEIF